MKKATLICGLLLICTSVFAQFGVSGGYRINDATYWELGGFKGKYENALADGYSVGIDYWFRLKNYRVEFLPEANFSTFKKVASPLIAKVNAYSFFANVNIYPFDFLGDCDCPTWSKQGKFFQKGFFLQISPGVSYLQQELQAAETYKSNATTWSLGAGVGFDIGITDLVTFSPIVGARYYLEAPWDGLAERYENDSDISTESANKQIFMGARLGFRFDYQSSRRR